jgi:glycyl-tRNA synthetase
MYCSSTLRKAKAPSLLPDQALLAEGEAGPLPAVMAAFARPTRIVRGKDVDAAWKIDADKFEMEEERALWGAYSGAARSVTPGMGIRDFLQVPVAYMRGV